MALLVKYTGKKRVKIDNIYTNKCWGGEGDVQPVDDEKMAVRMCRNHPDHFELVAPGEKPRAIPGGLVAVSTGIMQQTVVEEATGETVTLDNASRKALVKYVTDVLWMTVPEAHTKKDLLDMIVNHEELAKEFKKDDNPPPDEKRNELVTIALEESQLTIAKLETQLKEMQAQTPAPEAAPVMTLHQAMVMMCLELNERPNVRDLQTLVGDEAGKVTGKDRDRAWAAADILKDDAKRKTDAEIKQAGLDSVSEEDSPGTQ